ncbi:hypothetical protein M0802_002981 [Mischocyttarus mexicanus]|nr:hypothetical protein M0802_002981 [Mischocyttarus mexicanus]
MWRQRKSIKSCWCLPRKVVNVYSENELSIENKHNKNVKAVVKRMRKIQRLGGPKIKPKFFKQNCDSTTSGSGKKKKRISTSKASKRVKELALPKNVTSLKKVSENLRDPFKVNPSALKAICSPRTKLLAKPREIEHFIHQTT